MASELNADGDKPSNRKVSVQHAVIVLLVLKNSANDSSVVIGCTRAPKPGCIAFTPMYIGNMAPLEFKPNTMRVAFNMNSLPDCRYISRNLAQQGNNKRY